MGMMVRDKTKKDAYMCGTLLNMFSRKELRKNHPQQRKADKWKNDARDGFIATAIKHEDVDSIKICEQLIDGKVILWLIDGLQRLTVLEKYKKGVFKLGKNMESPIVYYQKPVIEDGEVVLDDYGDPVMEDIEYDLREKGFHDLPVELKERFDNYQIDVVKHLDCTDEEIGYHIRRYNRQTSMNSNENSITYMDTIAKKVKDISQSHRFFKDCGGYTTTEKNNGTCERVVCESLMAMFFLDKWQKNSKKLGAYLNENTTRDEFDILKRELDRLELAVGDRYKTIFTSKDSFLFFTLFHKFTLLCDDDLKFAEFLTAFQNDLHSRVVSEYNESFDDVNANRATKDKAVIMRKLTVLEKLMLDFLHREASGCVEEREAVSPQRFISDHTGMAIEEVTEDFEFYNQMLDELAIRTIKDGSPLLNPDNRLSLLAIVAYSLGNDIDLEKWLSEYARENRTYFKDPQKNYLHMKKDLERFLNGGR